ARMTQLPIFHINGEDPEAAYRALRIALDYRQAYKKDIVLDVVGFRKLGHNETDEPSYTQPLMYQRVKEHPGVRAKYSERLIREGAAPIDWAFAEALAFGSLALGGSRVRLSGQDSGRGTFSQRHAVLYDTQTGESWSPLAELRSKEDPEGQFEVFDSSLSEAGVLGFEYGYSV